MARAGFVLVGGSGSRMGTDKALLPYRGTVLAEHVACTVEQAAGPAVFVGPPERYEHLGRTVIPDLRPGEGPLAGVETALTWTRADWNLVVACDLAGLDPDLLRRLLEAAESGDEDCLVPLPAPSSPEPICAAWHRRCLPAVSAALDANRRKMRGFLLELPAGRWPVPTGTFGDNLNTPEDWARHLASLSSLPNEAGRLIR